MDENIVNELMEKSTRILSSQTSELIQNIKTPQRGILIYSEIVGAIDEFKDMLRKVDREGLLSLPLGRLKRLRELLDPIFQRIDHIQNTDKDPNRPDDVQKQQIVRFFTASRQQEDAYFKRNKEEIWRFILEIITLKNSLIVSGGGLQNVIHDLQTTKRNADELFNKLENILKTSQEELAKGGVGRHAQLFHEQAERHLKSANNWRINSVRIIMANAVVIMALYLVVSFAISDAAKKVETGVLSLLFISLISYVIVLCVRNYFAEKHNQLINQHKANCLETYNTFIESAPDEIKATILLHATQTIFSHQSPGYLSKEAQHQSPSPIMEIIRSVSRTSDDK